MMERRDLLMVLFMVLEAQSYPLAGRDRLEGSHVLARMKRYADCKPDEYYDPVVERCSLCSDVCQPTRQSMSFCIANCPDYYRKKIKGSVKDKSAGSHIHVQVQKTTAKTIRSHPQIQHQLIRKPLFWTSVVSMFIALIATIVIMVLCCIQRQKRVARNRSRAGHYHFNRQLVVDETNAYSGSLVEKKKDRKSMDSDDGSDSMLLSLHSLHEDSLGRCNNTQPTLAIDFQSNHKSVISNNRQVAELTRSRSWSPSKLATIGNGKDWPTILVNPSTLALPSTKSHSNDKFSSLQTTDSLETETKLLDEINPSSEPHRPHVYRDALAMTHLNWNSSQFGIRPRQEDDSAISDSYFATAIVASPTPQSQFPSSPFAVVNS